MDHYSILDRSSARTSQSGPAPVLETDLQQPSTTGTSASRVSATLAANALAEASSSLGSAAHPGLRFPGEDGGNSLAGMAQRDLDAALQLLAERAQYITEASGAAIALRRSQRNDMLCRASAGTNAPELGALLSTESGLSGESVRTRSALRCDDTERDPRVNRDGCRELGISSVVVMPIVRDEQVLGVFELFSGKAGAFGERDLSALERLSEMVETAVKLAETAQGLPPDVVAGPSESDAQSILDPSIFEESLAETPTEEVETEILATESMVEAEVPGVAALPEVAVTVAEPGPPFPAPPKVSPPSPEPPKISTAQKPVLWSAAFQASPEAQKPAQADQNHVPPVLRNLHKCWACGFPVSEGRKLCVECEEKQWRGQLRVTAPAQAVKDVARPSPELTRAISAPQALAAATGATPVPRTATFPSGQTNSEILNLASVAPVAAQKTTAAVAAPSAIKSDLPLFSGGIERSESWFSANKYIVGALLIVVAVVAAIVFLR
jgi:hypothetical protein